jgi:hypothetical protein
MSSLLCALNAVYHACLVQSLLPFGKDDKTRSENWRSALSENTRNSHTVAAWTMVMYLRLPSALLLWSLRLLIVGLAVHFCSIWKLDIGGHGGDNKIIFIVTAAVGAFCAFSGDFLAAARYSRPMFQDCTKCDKQPEKVDRAGTAPGLAPLTSQPMSRLPGVTEIMG